jgi:hypothetical protein
MAIAAASPATAESARNTSAVDTTHQTTPTLCEYLLYAGKSQCACKHRDIPGQGYPYWTVEPRRQVTNLFMFSQ